MSICDKCGDEFNKNQARRNIDSYWGDGRYRWISRSGNLCEYCATELLDLRDPSGTLVDPDDIYYAD